MNLKCFPKVNISIPFLCLLLLLYVMDFGGVFCPTFLAVCIHEMSHIIAIKLCGGNIDAIDIRAFGICVNVPELRFMSYKKEIIIAAAGPMAGILSALIGLATARFFSFHQLDFFIGVSIVITIINLIPVYPLDGGRIIMSLALNYLPLRVAYFVCYLFSVLAIGLLFGICIALAVKDMLNPSLLIFSLYVALCGFRLRNRF